MIKKFLNIKGLYLVIILLFALPSIIHIINEGFLLKTNEYFHFFINGTELANNSVLNAIIYAGFFIGLFFIYFIFLKKREKIFESSKEIFIFIILTAILFGLILPITSSDVFSYATTGEIQSEYGANPYYDKIIDVKQENDTTSNEILNSITIWDDQFVIYGPLWSLICGIVTFFSFSKISVAIILFKILAIAVHVTNAMLIYKIVKNKFWVIFYGLNPYILFETISNVHNDIYLIFFTLLALYFFVNKKKLILPMLFLAAATCIKYLTVLLVPILLIYFYRNETIGKRVLKCIKSGLLYVGFVILMYLIYLRNIEMIFYVFIQQQKFRESILAALYVLCINFNSLDIHVIILRTLSYVCLGLYILFIFKLLFKKEINFKEIMNSWNTILLIFILVYISNLCVWYFVWLFATAMWQKSENVKIIMYLPLIYEILISYYFYLGEELAIKTYMFSIISMIAVLGIISFEKNRTIEKEKRHSKNIYLKDE